MPPLDVLIDRITSDQRILGMAYSVSCRHSILWSEQDEDAIDPEMVYRLTLLHLIKRTLHPEAGKLRELLLAGSLDPALLYFHLMSVSYRVRKELQSAERRAQRESQDSASKRNRDRR